MKEPLTKVLFRCWRKEKDIIAIFPELPGTNSPYTCLSYQHIGQHGACDPNGLVRETRPATPSEYRGLKQELTNLIGYRLQIIHKLQYRFTEVRRKQIARIS